MPPGGNIAEDGLWPYRFLLNNKIKMKGGWGGVGGLGAGGVEGGHFTVRSKSGVESTALGRLPRSCGFDFVFGGASGKDALLVLSTECQDGQLALYIGHMQQ